MARQGSFAHVSPRRVIKGTLYTVAVLLFCILAAAPFLVMGIAAFQTDRDLYKRDASPFDYAEAPTLEHLDNLFNDTNYVVFIRNSMVVGAAVVVITLLLALPAAYSLARLTGRWGERAGILMFIVYLVPPTLLFIPLFRIIVTLGLSNSLLSLIVVYPTITVPFSAWLLMGFFKSIPPETEEAALVDGYHPYGAFLRVALPLARPGIISVIVFSHAHPARVHLRPGLHHPLRVAHPERRRPLRADPRRRLLLAAAARLRPDRRHPRGPGLQPVPRPPDPGLHRRRGQGLTAMTSPDRRCRVCHHAAELTVLPDLERSEGTAELTDEAEEALTSGSPRRRLRGLQRLSRAGDPDLVDWCALLLGDEDQMVRRKALELIGRSDEGDPYLLLPFTQCGHKGLRTAAVAGLARLGGAQAAEWCARGLRDTDDAVRIAGARELVRYDPQRHRRLFELALYDPHPQIAELAR